LRPLDRVHNARAGSGNVADLVVGGVCQHSAAAVATGVADDGLPTEFPHPAAAEDVLHTDRVDLKPRSTIRRMSILDSCNQRWIAPTQRDDISR